MRIGEIHDLEDLRVPNWLKRICLHHPLRSRLRASRLLRLRQSASLARSAGPITGPTGISVRDGAREPRGNPHIADAVSGRAPPPTPAG